MDRTDTEEMGMVRLIRRLFRAAALLGCCLLVSCAGLGIQVQGDGEEAAESPSMDTGAAAAPVEIGDNLDSAAFQSLPKETASYLASLSAAFRNRDRKFLVSQGEEFYEKEMRPRFDDESYLAMLYRAGPYSTAREWSGSVLPKLEYAKIKGIEYTAWQEMGPMLLVKGRIYLEKEESLPCEIMLIWRLYEPKILGAQP